jgi:pimeloyl-ACP methyl ester carboxylesterase
MGSYDKISPLFEGTLDGISQDILDVVERDAAEMAQVSPRGHLAGLEAPVFLLHGAVDNVIPAVETAWIAREVPRDLLRAALVSPAVVHVELGGERNAYERWAVLHFLAGVLAEVHAAHDRPAF